jgi:DNA-binding SARP family transcriptional activator
MNRARGTVDASWPAGDDTRRLAPGVDVFTASHSGSNAVTPVRVRLLGGFRVEHAATSQAVSDWPRRSAKTLIKLLAVQPGHALHREQVIDVLWPKADAESALNSFGKALHVARRALEPRLPRRHDSAYLRLRDGMLVLSTEHVVIDTDEFEQLAEYALRRQEITSYEAALAAYGGELLPEDRYESWCSERRGALAELQIRLLLGMAGAFEQRRSYGEAARRLRDVLQQDPTREDVHRQLMLLYTQMGVPDQAVRQFHDCEAVLRQELDLAPQPETIALRDDVLARRVSLQRPKRDRIGGQAGPRPSSPARTASGCPFVGRERVIRYMCDQLMRRDGTQPGMIVVSGEAGVGKTRLLKEFAIQASKQGALTLGRGRGAHADQFACGPFAVALEDYAANRPEAERAELARAYPALARFVPSLGAGIPLRAPAPDLRDYYYLELFPAIVQFLMDLARTKPVLLVLGDLHETDAVGGGLVRYLAHLAAGTPLLMAGVLRDPEIEADAGLRRMIEAMTRERLWLRIDLHCLSRRATDQLVHAMLPGAHVSDDTLAEIYAQSRGNPLFVRELVDGLSSRGDPDAADEDRQEPSWPAARLPTRTRILTGMQLALMDQPLRRVLGLAAVAGGAEISLGHLCTGAAALEPPLDLPVLFEALDRALRLRLLEERGEGYAFRHPVVRASFYESLPRHRRDELSAALTSPGGSSARPSGRLPVLLLSSGFPGYLGSGPGGGRTLEYILPVGPQNTDRRLHAVRISSFRDRLFQIPGRRLEGYWNLYGPC